MLKGRGRDPRLGAPASTPAHLVARPPAQAQLTTRQQTQAPFTTRQQAPAQLTTRQQVPAQFATRQQSPALRAPLAKPEPDYEVVDFPSEQYVNAKLQQPPPPPPRPPTGHPLEAGASCGLCGGGGARVRCAECGRRALCASCDDMYHRHPKRRHHQRQALTSSQLRDERPPLPPKVTPPVPPPRRHKLSGDRSSASPRPPGLDQRRATVGNMSMASHLAQSPSSRALPHQLPMPAHLQGKLAPHAPAPLVASMPYLPPAQHAPSNAMGHLTTPWGRQRGSLPGFHVPPNVMNMNTLSSEAWESPESVSPSDHSSPWSRPMRRGASVLELGGAAGAACGGCAHCAAPWRYGSCASLEHPWPAHAWPTPACCLPPPHHHAHMHHASHTPQPYRRAESRTMSRAVSRAASRAVSPAGSARSRVSRRVKPRTPSPPPLPSSDADSESESDTDHRAHNHQERSVRRDKEVSLGPAPSPPSAAWQCEHCTFVNEPGVRVCAVCCRTPTAAPLSAPPDAAAVARLSIAGASSPPPPPANHDPRATQNGEGTKRPVKERASTGFCPSPPREEQLRKPINRLVTPTREHNQPRTEPRSRHDMGVGPSPPRSVQHTKQSMGTGPSPPRELNTKQSMGVGPSPPREWNTKQSMGVGPSPPRQLNTKQSMGVGPSPPRELNTRQSMGVGPSPPRELNTRQSMGTGPSPPRESNVAVRVSPYVEAKISPHREVYRYDASAGPSPPRDTTLRPSMGISPNNYINNTQKRSTGTSPPRERVIESRSSSASTRANVSNTGTSPPPQSISTQTYEVPARSARAPSAPRSRPRRRLRDEARRERSHSRHSLSSDTRESERSVRTTGGASGRWEWRETRDSSPGGEWSGGEGRREARRLARRASHLDLRRARPERPDRPARRSSFYGSEAASPEPLSSHRALSLEALASAGSRREAERGLELARLMSDAERQGFSAAEVHAALAQSPTAPLAWLRERWPSLCAGVRAAAARLAPGAAVTELAARAALARHRGAMWPAVNDCVERHRRQAEALGVGEEGRVRGHVWGAPAGADDDAAPPTPGLGRSSFRARAEDSSDEFEAPTPTKSRDDDDWMYLPLEPSVQRSYDLIEPIPDIWIQPHNEIAYDKTEDIAHKLKTILMQAGVPAIDENLLLKGLLADNTMFKAAKENNEFNVNKIHDKPQSVDLVQSEIDFIDAYNALTRLSPLPNISNPAKITETMIEKDSINGNLAPLRFDLQAANNTNLNNKFSNTDNLLLKNAQNQRETNNTSELQILNIVQEIISSKENEPDSNNINVELHSTVSNKVSTNEQLEMTTPKKDIPQEDAVGIGTTTESNHVVAMSNKNNNLENTADISTKIDKFAKEEERSSNLSDIVDNTQKLIQQMKEEINSDINSLDGRKLSQSEADSNDSDLSTEHESTYSRSEGETDDITSDENDTSGENQDDGNVGLERSGTVMNRTSSEDNEQFEEAMDHIEEQNETFKQANIEILDSIARSLQEEHTNSLEIQQSQIPKAPEPKFLRTRKQDLNNNLFASVNSFEEIYDQLNPTTVNMNSINEQSKSSIIQSFKEDITLANSSEKRNIVLEKQPVNISLFTPIAPTKLIIFEQEIPVYNAEIDNIAGPLLVLENASLDNNSSIVVEFIGTPLRRITDVVENNIDDSIATDNTNDSLNINTQLDASSINLSQSLEQAEVGDEIYEDYDNAHSNTTINNMSPEIENDLNLNRNYEDQHAIDSNSLSLNALETSNIAKKEQTYLTVAKAKSKSPEKSTRSDNDSNINKNSTMIKSNIPKPVRVTPSNKQKADKPPSKVIASKVPVRRGSIKHYPAPAPPKTHFGNIQNGHVKQLQTRLFNSKLVKATTNPPTLPTVQVADSAKPPTTVEVKPSTSTLNKRRPAPLPPSKPQETKQPSPPNASSHTEKKKNYFRETCRTEDEWTESDSEDSQFQIEKASEEPQRAPSPPPPITLRRVSGQLVDLARIRLMEGSPERQARMLLAEGATESWEQAQVAVELVSRGAEPPAALLAALECVDLSAALAYLHQDCELCASRCPEHEMVSMLRCTHRCCRECARHYFTVQITERSIADCVCPYCKEPELETLPEDAWLEYFAHIDILLKTLVDPDIHELFQRKLRDRTLARDPNFRWCVECSSGFFVHPKQKKLRCPECKSVSCASCRKPWSASHEGLTCEQYAAWVEDNDPERSAAAVQQHLKENGLECPRCRFKYSLSRGGCMHFTCTQCKFEFCYGCGKPFMMGARCGLSEYCAKLGLHAHHPRNCLFYLRDKEPHELQTLLQMNNVPYEVESPEGCAGRCPVQLQRETPAGLVDGACGADVAPRHAGLCKNHYLEYLSRAVRARCVDPLPLLGVDDLETLVRRAALRLPPRPYGSLEGLYRRALAEIVKEKIPLD